jgi:hypothetical protein
MRRPRSESGRKVKLTEKKPTEVQKPAADASEAKDNSNNKFMLVIDRMEDGRIDPRALGKLMIELNGKVDLVVVHGDISTDDVVVKLCNGLGFEWRQLYDASGKVFPEYVGRKVLVGCQAGQKPEFRVLGEE